MKYLKDIHTTISKYKLYFFGIQFILSGIAVGILAWDIVAYTKDKLFNILHFDVTPWTYIFFHPYGSNLLNYIFLSVSMGIYGLLLYILANKKIIERISEKLEKEPFSFHPYLIIPSILLLTFLQWFSLSFRLISAFIIIVLPVIYLINLERIVKRKLLISCVLLLLIIISLEPFNMVKGPIYLMNEYEDLHSETLMEGKYVNNKSYLDSLSPVDIESVKAFYILKNKYENKIMDKIDNIDFYQNPDIQFRDMRPEQNYLNSMIAAKAVTLDDEDINDDVLNNMAKIDVESVKQFYLKNKLEYSHQNMSRGQINHIGHILNPINEFITGKPLKDIYLQYGLGNTFIMKWTMELFGKVSIENYHKCYVYYVLYFIFFLLMLFPLFKDNIVYILGVFIILAASHYYWRYTGFVLAPGIIPTIHMFDATVLIFMLLFLRHDSVFYLGTALLFAFFAILVNSQFGMMLSVSLFISLILYSMENKKGAYKFVWLFVLFTIFTAMVVIPSLLGSSKTGNVFSYFLFGLFSWPAPRLIIALTICYLIVSYVFLFFLREKRFYLKYIYTFIFIYTQCLFVYFYWSGLANHLPMVLPFAGLQLFLMIFILEEEFSMRGQVLSLVKVAIIVVAVIFLAAGMKQFYKDKKDFQHNFTDHKIYHWTFDRANIVTTINPKPIEESLSLIRKYSPQEDDGIIIISKYDNLLPFLAERSNYLSFELAWHLLSNKDVNDAINRINEQKPKYLFVDSNIDQETFDPWSKIYSNDSEKNERVSRLGRYSELQKVFRAVHSDYERIEQGELLTVYGRRE